MKEIRKFVRDELRSVLNEIMNVDSEGNLIAVKNNDDIIGNYTQGREFAFDKLQSKIENLEKYELTDYLPKDENTEKWSFEFPLIYGGFMIVDIEHNLSKLGSLWSLQVGHLYKGEELPNIIKSSNPIKGYKNFIEFANSNMSKFISPNDN